MTRERIEDIREIILPFVRKVLLKTNYENLGKSDAEEFTRDFNEILELAIKELEQESILDKIRAEIESQREEVSRKHSENDATLHYYFGLNDRLKDARDILDKYKTEVR